MGGISTDIVDWLDRDAEIASLKKKLKKKAARIEELEIAVSAADRGTQRAVDALRSLEDDNRGNMYEWRVLDRNLAPLRRLVEDQFAFEPGWTWGEVADLLLELSDELAQSDAALDIMLEAM